MMSKDALSGDWAASPEDARAAVEMQGKSSSDLDEARLKREMDRLTRAIRTSAVGALEGISQNAMDAVPQLALLLNDSDKMVRVRAAIALWRMTGSADVAPVLTEAIYPPMPEAAWQQWVDVLGEMGPAAVASVPTLLRLARWGNPEIREPALTALAKIDPASASELRLSRKPQ